MGYQDTTASPLSGSKGGPRTGVQFLGQKAPEQGADPLGSGSVLGTTGLLHCCRLLISTWTAKKQRSPGARWGCEQEGAGTWKVNSPVHWSMPVQLLLPVLRSL